MEPEFSPVPAPTPVEITLDRPEDIFQRAEEYRRAIDTAYIGLGRELYLIFHRRLYIDRGYETFDDWCEREFGMSSSRGERVRRIWTKFIRELHLRVDQLSGIGYTRALNLLPVVTRENADEWLEKARTMEWRDLKNEIDAAKTPPEVVAAFEEAGAAIKQINEGSADMPPSPTTTAPESTDTPLSTTTSIVDRKRKIVTLKLYDDQMEVWRAALAEAQRSKPTEMAPNEALANICTEFLAARTVKEEKPLTRVSFYLRWFEEIYGGKFLWVKGEEALPYLEEAVEKAGADLIEANPAAQRLKEEFNDDHPDDGIEGQEGT